MMFRTLNNEKSSLVAHLYSLFPTLVVQNQSCTKLSLLRSVGCYPLIVKLVCPNFPSSKGSCVYGDEETLFMLKNSQESLNAATESSTTVEELLHKLSDLLLEVEQTNPKLCVADHSVEVLNVSSQILTELETVGWENVSLMSPDLTTVHLSYVDERDTTHTIQILFPPNYPSSPLSVTHQLPDCWEAPLTTSLSQTYNTWVEAVTFYLPCWSALHDLDRLCWVLDPDRPGTQHLYRRLVVATSVSLHLVLDPSSPLALPSLRFLGADQRISPLRESLATNMDLWEEEDPLLTNLERVLGVEFPSRTDSTKDEWSVECGICYSYRLGEQLPTKNCDDPRCCQPFHSSCLYEWLVSLPGCRTTLNMVHGECPYCSRPLQCSRPTE
eukprot:GFUD01000666.1.p1 GENE.GFUD01000666.1~~GFUD01000666.1.p1  ORF type:complete len:384 (-),score=100.35 GFUD01000666.1:35-1186(-)